MRFELFPSADATLSLRLRRQLMGFMSYLMFLLPLGYSVQQGWMDFGYRGLAWFTVAAALLNIGFFAAIRSGLSARLRDPDLTLPQIATSMLFALVVLHHANEARSILLMLFFASLFFGVFGLSKRQFLALAATAAGGYLLLIAYEFRGIAWDDIRLRMEWLHLLTLSMILLWMSLVGSYISGLRRQLARKKDELAEAMARLLELVSHDELTGAFNRRHLMDILNRERERSDRFGHSFSVCILDLDHFKRVNDQHGHAAGDDVLRGFSERMRACARKIDWLGRQEADTTFGRYGGEEFLLVLPHTPLEGARLCVERIRSRVQAEPFATVSGALQVSFSAGIAEHRADESVASTLSRADEALYRAKANGRSRTEVAD